MSLPPLQPDQLVKPRHFDLRMSLIFGAAFVALGVHVPYLPLWLEAEGFGPEEIAVILSAPMFLRVFTPPVITSMADRAKDRANMLIMVSAVSFLASLGLFLTPAYGVVLAVVLVLSIFWTPQTVLADSIALSGVRRFGSSYARMRIWGSLSFLGANFFGGLILAATGAGAVPAMIAAGLLASLVFVLFTPRLGPPRLPSPLSATGLQAAPKLLNRYFLLFAAGAGLIVASHAMLYSFASIYWKSVGLGDTTIGLLWAWSVAAEVAILMVFDRVFGKLRSTTVLAIAGIASILRWLAFPLVAPLGFGTGGFLAVQALHAFSTGLVLVGLQKMIGETVPDGRTGAAQGVAFFANGFSMGLATLACGPLYDRLGGDGFYVMVGVAAVGLGLIVAAGRRDGSQPQSAGSGGDTSEPR